MQAAVKIGAMIRDGRMPMQPAMWALTIPKRQNASGRMTRIDRPGCTPCSTELASMKVMNTPQKAMSQAPGRTVRDFHPRNTIASVAPVQEPRNSNWSMPAPPAPSRAAALR